VIRRYESGGVATNAECDAIYGQALERLGGSSDRATVHSYRNHDSIPATQSRIELPRQANSSESVRGFAGMKGNPVHVVVDEGTTRFI
jgi:hypothetical protein